MIKYFPYNKSYYFKEDGQIFIDGVYFTTHKAENLITIETSHGPLTNTFQWFFLVSHYCLDIDFHDLTKVIFVKCDSKVLKFRCGYNVFYKEPISIKDDYFRIPGFSGFMINREGVIKSIKTGRILSKSLGPYGYPYVNIRDYDKDTWRSVNLHLLFAKTFVKNPDPERLLFVNHKDGNKENFTGSNLEWVTSRDNQNHAIENNLRDDNIPVLVLDLFTKEVLNFKSKTKAFLFMGYVNGKISPLDSVVDGLRIPKLIKNRYEVKIEGDSSPWYHLKNDTINKVILNGPYFAKKINSGEVFFATSLRKLSDILDIDATVISSILKNGMNRECKGYIFKAGVETSWCEDIVFSSYKNKRKFKIYNTVTKLELVFDSLRSLTNFLCIDKRTILLRLERGQDYKEWKINEVF